MAKMKNLIMDMEEMFWEGAQDIVHEYQNFLDFEEVMKNQKDLVKHWPSWEAVRETLEEIYCESHDNWIGISDA